MVIKKVSHKPRKKKWENEELALHLYVYYTNMKTQKYIKFLPLVHHEKLEHLGGMCKHLVNKKRKKNTTL